MNTESLIKMDRKYILGTYGKPEFVLAEGSGMVVKDLEGKEYLDFASGIAVNALGHSDPDIVAAIQQQATQLSHVSNLYHSIPQIVLAREICESCFGDKVFFSNSGAEAVETALKMARKFAHANSEPERVEFITFSGSFHGRTMGALSVTAREKYQAPFRPLLPGIITLPFNDIDSVAEAISIKTCAVIIEPIQGEGGIIPVQKEFLQGLKSLCQNHGALLIFDEIQCGMGRTGKLWAHEHFDVTPDIMTSAKALGGGLPIGATVMTDTIADIVQIGDHGSTFAGGPVTCAASLAVFMKVNTQTMLSHISRMGALLVASLKNLENPAITDIRGAGLMIGIQISRDAGLAVRAAAEKGLLVVNAGPDVVRLMPPYIVSETEIADCVRILNEILQEEL